MTSNPLFAEETPTSRVTAFAAHAISQIAYFVPDVRAAALRHATLFGSGPFFVMEHVPLDSVVHRGRPTHFDHTAAFGQWGEVMLEFVQQNHPGASILHDLYPEDSGRFGLHHVACMVEDLEKSVAHFTAAGSPEVFRARIAALDIEGVMMDTVATYGHFVELYPAVPAMTGFYAMVAAAAREFDGRDPVRAAPSLV
jgi:catechol 2,3-dioxygenase-like lactoylglutathione lyase family enzyme